MARIERIELIDDLDGTEAEETVGFSLDGVAYEMDLSKRNADKLRKALAPYTDKARRAAPALGIGRRRRRHTASPPERDYDPRAIRVWADQAGVALSSRGRIPGEVVAQWRAATGG